MSICHTFIERRKNSLINSISHRQYGISAVLLIRHLQPPCSFSGKTKNYLLEPGFLIHGFSKRFAQMPESQMPEFPERKRCVSQVVGRCFCHNENRYPTFTYRRGHLRLFLYWEGSIPPTKHPRQNYKLLEPISFPPCAVCPAAYRAHSIPPDSDLYSYLSDAGDRHCFTGCSIASQTANARLAAPNMHSANQRLSFLPNTNPRTISAKPSKAANTIIQKPMF